LTLRVSAWNAHTLLMSKEEADTVTQIEQARD
jgi:hypothetical protein